MLCTTAQVKDAIGITGSADDARITTLIAEATQTIMRRYGREFVPHIVATRSFRLRHQLVNLAPFDLRSVTAVTLQPAARALAAAEYHLLPIGGMERTGTFAQVFLRSEPPDAEISWLEINGAWGCWVDAAAVAEDIRRAAIETVASWLDRPAAAIAGIVELSEPHLQRQATATSWDIPASAHRKLQMYSRNLGVY